MSLLAWRKRSALALLTVMALAASAVADDESENSSPAKIEPQAIKVVALKHRGPEEMRILLNQFTPFNSSEGAPQATPLRVVVDARTQTLLLRGTDAQLKRADRLVKALDVAVDKLSKGEIEGLMLLPLKHAKPAEIMAVVQQLGITTIRTLKIGETSVFAFPTKEENIKELCELVEILDKEGAVPSVAATESDN